MVSGWSGPSMRVQSTMRAPASRAAMVEPPFSACAWARLARAISVLGVVGAEDAVMVGDHLFVQAQGGGGVTRGAVSVGGGHADVQGVGMLLAQDTAVVGVQGLVIGGSGAPAVGLPCSSVRLWRMARVAGSSGPRMRVRSANSASAWCRAVSRSPVSPTQRTRLWRVTRVLGWSGPRMRSTSGAVAEGWSRSRQGVRRCPATRPAVRG